MTWQTGAAIVLSYVAGSIPTGLWFGKALRGVDIREHGSRNSGATNTLRVLGKKLGAIALAGDVGKGLVAVLVIAPLLSDWPYAPLACGVAAIVGHIASVFVKFRGGKGVATSTGVFLALTPVATVIAAGVFAGVVYATRMVLCASPTYLARQGTPVHPSELVQHHILAYSYWSSRDEWAFDGPDGVVVVKTTPCLRGNNGDTCRAVALAHGE